MIWELPESVEINGFEYSINADYRNILEIIRRLSDINESSLIKSYVALAMFYPEFDAIPEELYQEAANKMQRFIACGEEDDGKKHPKLIDWEQDYRMIVSDINKVAGKDVRGERFLHWWTFVSLFNAIGEGQLSFVVGVREKLRKGKKLSPDEREFYRKNRSKVDFKRSYSNEENDLIKKWTGT